MFENRVLRKVFGLKKGAVTGDEGRICYESFMICVSHEVSFG